MKILVTGCAGFIGMHAAARLLGAGHAVVGIEYLNDYYDPALKESRLRHLVDLPGFEFNRLDLADLPALQEVFARHRFDRILHLAAQAGVRHSLTNPHAYVSSNLAALVDLLEYCRDSKPRTWSTRSSSSVYGANSKQPFSTHDPIDHPVSIYAVTKRSNELMAHSYSHLFALPTTGLRFFTAIRILGPARHVDGAVHRRHPRRPADQRLQPRQDAPRFHLRRRHRRRRGAGAGPLSPQATPGGRQLYRPGAQRRALPPFNIGNNWPVPLMGR